MVRIPRMLLALGAGLLLVAGGLVLHTRPADPIKVGFAGQLEGLVSDLGVQGRNGAQLAIEHINERGGIYGRPLMMFAEHDGYTPGEASNAARNLLGQGVVAIIGHMTSSQTMASLPIVTAANRVLISPTVTTPDLTGKTDAFFRVIPDNPSWAKALADYAHEQGIRQVHIISDTTNAAFSAPFVKAFTTSFAQHGGIALSQQPINTLLRSSLDQAVESVITMPADGVVLATSARDAAQLAQKLRTAAPRLRLFSSSWAYTREIFLAGGSDVEGMIFALSFRPDDTSPAYVAFQQSYRARFGWEPNFAASYAYEAVLVLAAALEKTGGKPEGLREALVSVHGLQGVTGPITLDAYGDVTRDTHIVTISEGSFITVR